MAKFVEMDETVTMKEQMEEEVSGPVILINKFNVEPEKIDQFLKGWQEDATKFKQQPGLVLHNYIRELVRVAYSLTMQFGNP